MSKKISLSVFIFALIAAIIVSFMSAFAVVSDIYRDRLADPYGVGEDAINLGELYYIDAIFKELSILGLNNEELLDAAIKGYVVGTGDRYAWYYTAEEYAELRAADAGTPQGIGIRVDADRGYGYLQVIFVNPGSPADRAGVAAGDKIYYVGIGEGRERVAKLGYNGALSALQGKAGTDAEFTVVRDGTEVEFKIPREVYASRSVIYRLSETAPDVGIIRILEFDLSTPAQFCEAMDFLISQGVGKFVFDVRDNPGGDLASIQAVMSYFLKEGDIILTAQRKSGADDVYKVETKSYNNDDYKGCEIVKDDIGKYGGMEYVVLVNGNSASAAEVFAANFRDYALAPLVGVKTFGKGVMQNLISLEAYGLEGMLRLTTAKYLPPSGESYNGIGITPDEETVLETKVENVNLFLIGEADDAQLIRAISLLK